MSFKFNKPKPEDCKEYQNLILALSEAKEKRHVTLVQDWHGKLRCRTTCNVRSECEKLIAEQSLKELKRFIPSQTLVISSDGLFEDKEAMPSSEPDGFNEDADEEIPKIEA